MAIVDDIKSRLDILDLVSRYATLQRSGRSYRAPCPFHSERTPSFYVFPERQSWRCFGACATGGDIFSFFMQAENLQFGEALRRLAQEAGIDLPNRSSRGQTSVNFEINEEADRYFARVLQSDEGTAARTYLHNREVSAATISTFELGFSPAGGRALRDYLSSRGHTTDQMVAAGLVTKTESGEYRDLFRGRLTICIRGEDGNLRGFGGRALDDSTPKYLNSPKTSAFDKGRILYGLHLAKDTIRKEGTVVVVEGYMDAIMAHQHGFNNVVASMGTALTQEQASTLRALAPEVILALDPDTAGQEATLRSMESAWGVFHSEMIRPSGGGTALYHRPELPRLKVASLPQGQDPDAVIRKDPDAWTALVAQAVPLFDYLFTALSARFDPVTPDGKAQLSQLLFPLVASIGDTFLQDHYFQRLASLLGVSVESLQSSLGRALSSATRSRPKPAAQVNRRNEASTSPFQLSERDPLEELCIAMLLQSSEPYPGTESLQREYFLRPENREALACWREGNDPDIVGEEVRSHWDYLQAIQLPPSDRKEREAALEDYMRRLEARHLRRLKAEEEMRLGDASPAELDDYENEVLSVNERIRDLLAEKVL